MYQRIDTLISCGNIKNIGKLWDKLADRYTINLYILYLAINYVKLGCVRLG